MSENRVVANRTIPLSEPLIAGNEWKYIKECLDSGMVSSIGSYVTKFEKEMASFVGTKYAVATMNGTAALHVSLLASGVKPDDEVIVPALTFIAPVNSVVYCNAVPVFMDCYSDDLCMDSEKFSKFIEKETVKKNDGFSYNKKSGRRIKAVIPVHVFGNPVEMDSLLSICGKANISVIEDATESLGTTYKGKHTGSFGELGCFSFNGNKIITTGGGGMITTDNEELAKKIRHLTTQAKSDSIECDHDEVGYNYRLTNILAAMGVAQLEQLGDILQIKRKNGRAYKEALSEISDIEFLWEKPEVKSNFWFYAIRIKDGRKKELMEQLLSRGISARPVWKLIHTLPMYSSCQAYEVEKAVEAQQNVLTIPCGAKLTSGEIDYVCENIKSFFG